MDALLDECQDEKMDDLEVDVTDCSGNSVMLENEEDSDATENSSSFGGTFSGSDDISDSKASDVEVNSQFRGENAAQTMFDGVNRMFRARKKRLTTDWKKYIRSISWRCKWIELRMHELQSQAKRYERELLASARKKQQRSKRIEVKSFACRLLPQFGENRSKCIMKRRKRNKIEHVVDIISYMSHHNLFSYYEKKKFEADGSSDDEDANQVISVVPNSIGVDGFGLNFEGFSYEFGDGDSFEQVLWTIEVLHSRIGNLKTELDKVVSKHRREQRQGRFRAR